jgi:hypothetical protein
MRKTILMVATLIGMLFAFSQGAMAQTTCDPTKEKCPPPPTCDPTKEKCDLDCSPGYWKNHVGVWCGIGRCATGADCDDLVDDLKLKGNDPARAAADAFLTECLLELDGTLPCTSE